MQFGPVMSKCKYGCPTDYKEDSPNHVYMYHEMKTMCLMCGCGYGDIFIGRFRKHLLEAHGEPMTYDDVVSKFFWHDMPEFQQILRCMNSEFRGKCQFRTPHDRILHRFHACKTAMTKSDLPEKNKFFKFLHRKEPKPKYGMPKYEDMNDRRIKTRKGDIVKLQYDYLIPALQPTPEELERDARRKKKPRKDNQYDDAQGPATPPRERRRHRRDRHESSQESGEYSGDESDGPDKYSVTIRNDDTVASDPEAFDQSTPQREAEAELLAELEAEANRKTPRRADDGENDFVYDALTIGADGVVASSDEEETQVMSSESDRRSGAVGTSESFMTTSTSAVSSESTSILDSSVSEVRKLDSGKKQPVRTSSVDRNNSRDRRRKQPQRRRSSSARGRTYAARTARIPTLKRDPFEVDYEWLGKLQVPNIGEGASPARATLARYINPPEGKYIEYGPIHMAKVEARLMMYAMKELRPSVYFVTDIEGRTHGYASVTLHHSNPRCADYDRKYLGLNPLNYPIWIVTYDTRSSPEQAVHYVCMSCPVLPGEYRFVTAPVDRHTTPIAVHFRRCLKDFGSATGVRRR